VRATYFGPVTDRNRRRIDRSSAARDHHGGAGSPMSEWTPTTCMRCAVGCGHLQQGYTNNYGLDTVRGDASHPVNRGLACQRGVSETADPRRGLADAAPRQGGRHPRPHELGDGDRDGRLAYRGRAGRNEGRRRGAGKRPADERGGVRAGEARAGRLRHPVLRRQHHPLYGLGRHRLLPGVRGATRRRRPTRTSPTPRPT